MHGLTCARKMKSQTQNIMKQFSLEEYLANPSKKVVTRDGRSVKIHCTNYIGAQHIIAQVEGNEYSSAFSNDGRYIVGKESPRDLFFAPEKHEGWLNLFKDTLGIIYGGCVYTSKDEAKEEEHPTDKESPVATIKIEWEE